MDVDAKMLEVLGELERQGVDVSGCTGKFYKRLKRELKTEIEMGIPVESLLRLITSLDDVVGFEYYGLDLTS